MSGLGIVPEEIWYHHLHPQKEILLDRSLANLCSNFEPARLSANSHRFESNANAQHLMQMHLNQMQIYLCVSISGVYTAAGVFHILVICYTLCTVLYYD